MPFFEQLRKSTSASRLPFMECVTDFCYRLLAARDTPKRTFDLLLGGAIAYLSLFIPPATTIQATVYSHFVPQPQAKNDQ